METFTTFFDHLTGYDMVVLGILFFFLLRGLWVGALRQITVFFALYIGYIAASQYYHLISPMLGEIFDNPRIVFLASYALLFLAAYIVVLLLGKLLKMVVNLSLAGWFDSLVGGVVGLLKAVIVVVLLHMLLGTILAPENSMLRSCAVCPQLNTASDFTRNIIRDPEARKSLLQQKPAIDLDTVKKYLDSAEGVLQKEKKSIP